MLTKEQQIAADWLAWLNNRVSGLPEVYEEARDSLVNLLLAAQHRVERTVSQSSESVPGVVDEIEELCE